MRADGPPRPLVELARIMGVATGYRDDLDREHVCSAETIVRACAALGAPIDHVDDAADAVRELRQNRRRRLLEPVSVAWNGRVRVAVDEAAGVPVSGVIELEDGPMLGAISAGNALTVDEVLPLGYHRLHVEVGDRVESCAIISAPIETWHPSGSTRRWGVAAHLAALRSSSSRSVGDLGDLAVLARWLTAHGGDLIALLPLLPTFNDQPTEPSPYSPVSRLFWSELILDLGPLRQPVERPPTLSVERADAEVRAALARMDDLDPGPIDDELATYARFRGAQRRLGRDWRRWPAGPRAGLVGPADVDPLEESFHLRAQTRLRRQLDDLTGDLDRSGVGLGLDLAVGVHPLGYDTWSRPDLFATGISVGAPPDPAFPSGQSWGFPPVLPDESRREHHAYHRACVAHQAARAGVLRVDHVMAMHRLYWIPEGMEKDHGAYVHYPAEEMFAVLCVESHRHRCEIVGENLGLVAEEIDEALSRHRVWGMFLAELEATADDPIEEPPADATAMIGTHDTPTFAGWLETTDIDERIDLRLLGGEDAVTERVDRLAAQRALADQLGADVDHTDELFTAVLSWLGGSESPLVVVWLEDLWLETRPVNIPGSSSAARPNWQRPIRAPLDVVLDDPDVTRRVNALVTARRAAGRRIRARGS